MSIMVGLTKMTYFAKLANLARIHQRSGKKFKASWLLAILTKMARTHQRFCKTSNEVTKREMAIIRKWQILGEKGKFRQKWRVCQKVIEASAKYTNKMTKSSILTNGDFTKITNLTRIYRFGKN